MKTVSLLELTKLISNESVSEKYVDYCCGFDGSHQYRHIEIISIEHLLRFLQSVDEKLCDGFIYGYTIPQLNKEFDLLKISDDLCLNIELKSTNVGIDKIKNNFF